MATALAFGQLCLTSNGGVQAARVDGIDLDVSGRVDCVDPLQLQLASRQPAMQIPAVS